MYLKRISHGFVFPRYSPGLPWSFFFVGVVYLLIFMLGLLGLLVPVPVPASVENGEREGDAMTK